MDVDYSTGRRDPSYVALGDAYFRRLLVPLVVTLLFMFGVVAILYAQPGTDLNSSAGLFSSLQRGGWFGSR